MKFITIGLVNLMIVVSTSAMEHFTPSSVYIETIDGNVVEILRANIPQFGVVNDMVQALGVHDENQDSIEFPVCAASLQTLLKFNEQDFKRLSARKQVAVAAAANSLRWTRFNELQTYMFDEIKNRNRVGVEKYIKKVSASQDADYQLGQESFVGNEAYRLLFAKSFSAAQKNKTLIKKIPFKNAVGALAFSNDSKLIAGAAEWKAKVCRVPLTIGNVQGLLIWDAQSGDRLHKFMHFAWVNCIAFDQQGTCVAGGDQAGRLLVWDLKNKEGKRRFYEEDDTVDTVAFTSDGMQIAGLFRRGKTFSGLATTIRFYDVKTGEKKREITPNEYKLVSFLLSPDDKFILLGARQKNYFYVLNLETHEEKKIEDDVLLPGTIVANSDWSLFATEAYFAAGIISLFDVKTQQKKSILCGDDSTPTDAITFSPDGRHIVARDVFKTRIWHLESPEKIVAELNHAYHNTSRVDALFSPNGKMLAVGGDDEDSTGVFLYQLPSCEMQSKLRKLCFSQQLCIWYILQHNSVLKHVAKEISNTATTKKSCIVKIFESLPDDIKESLKLCMGSQEKAWSH